MPERRAASGFPPTAYTERPNFVWFIIIYTIAKIISSIIAGIGIENIWPAPILLYHSGSVVTGKPLDKTAATPNKTAIIPSVIINEGILKYVRSHPLNSPIITETITDKAIPASTPYSIGIPDLASKPVVRAMITPVSPTVDPIERSISPAIITIVIPNAITPCKEIFLSILSKFPGVKKPGDIIVKVINIIKSIISSVYLFKKLFKLNVVDLKIL